MKTDRDEAASRRKAPGRGKASSRDKTPIDTALQAQVDAQLMEQGAFAPLELLIDSGRLLYADYESWRRREVEWLDGVLMGSPEKIREQLEQSASYASSIGLVEQEQEFHEWPASAGSVMAAETPAFAPKRLRVSADPKLHKLICSRYVPAQDAPQMDLFFDNPVVALTNGIVRALSAKNSADAQRQLDHLYAHAPNHADLAAFDRLVAALGHLDHVVPDARAEQDFLLQITPTARRLLGSQSRDLLAPLWRQVARALEGCTFPTSDPTLHRSYALSQAQDWAGVSECVLSEPQWWRHAALCLRLAQSGFYRRRRAEALTGWFHLCWLNPEQATEALDNRQQPDAELAASWHMFLDAEEECSGADGDGGAGGGGSVGSVGIGAGDGAAAGGAASGGGGREACPRGGSDVSADGPLTAADFPAWTLLHEPALAGLLDANLPTGATPGENHYRCVHQWIHARRAGRQDEEIALRRELQLERPALFRYLKLSVSRRGEVRR